MTYFSEEIKTNKLQFLIDTINTFYGSPTLNCYWQIREFFASVTKAEFEFAYLSGLLFESTPPQVPQCIFPTNMNVSYF